jgi:hypothetical protein
MKEHGEITGHILVKLLISLISVSVISTALLNLHQNAGQRVYYEDLSSLLSMQARTAFDRLNYHIKLAGYANTRYQKPLDIIKCEDSDSLRVYHNDVEILFYVDKSHDSGVLCESIDGSVKRITDGVEALRLNMSTFNVIAIELVLSHNRDHDSEEIVSRGYSTSIKLDRY